jgi:hypothetical protein
VTSDEGTFEHDDHDDGADQVDGAHHVDDDGVDDPGPDFSAVAGVSAAEHTGNPVVDSVLDSLRELDRLPVSEHVAVFEAAHDRLRGALSDAGDPPADA